MKSQQPITVLLKNKEEVYTRIHEKRGASAMSIQFILLSLVALALFGAVISTWFPHWWHARDLTWKTIALLWGPTLICAPSLYVFSTIRGSKLTLTQLALLMSGMLATTGIVLLALAPISWFFTWSTDTVQFVQMMNIGMIAVSLLFGLFFFTKGISVIHSKIEGKDGTARFTSDVLLVWFILFVIVVAQMAQKLGPWYR